MREIIGEGSSAVVARCKDTRTKQTVAVKIVAADLGSGIRQSEVRSAVV